MKRPLLWSTLVVIGLTQLSASALADRDGDRGRDRDDDRHIRGNVFVNDPCLDPPPPDFQYTVQSETEIAVLNSVWDDDRRGRDDRDDDDHDRRGDRDDDDEHESGRLMVAGYNDSFGNDFPDNRQGYSGFSYSTNGGRQWIDGGGLPPAAAGDRYLGQPSVAVHHRTRTFYYASVYLDEAFNFTISVNRGRFKVAPRQVPVESFANTRCARGAPHGVPDEPSLIRERIIWEPPVAATLPNVDFLEFPWLYVNQETGVLYLTYKRFGTFERVPPLELVRSFDGGRTWVGPSIITSNLFDELTGAKAVVTPTGRVVVTWFAHTLPFFGAEEQRIEAAFSDDCRGPADPCTFSPPTIVRRVNPQPAPPGDNRAFGAIVPNLPYIAVDKGRDDGRITRGERRKPGFGNVYITYFDGRTPFDSPLCDPFLDPNCVPFASAADILLSRSTDGGATFKPAVKVNDDPGDTSHVFPSVQVNKFGEVFVTWLDRRRDRPRNLLTDTWGDISSNEGRSFGRDGRISTVSTDWFVRADYTPNFGNYNSSDVVGFTHFVSIWADGRFPRPADGGGEPPDELGPETPDTLIGIVKRSGDRK